MAYKIIQWQCYFGDTLMSPLLKAFPVQTRSRSSLYTLVKILEAGVKGWHEAGPGAERLLAKK